MKKKLIIISSIIILGCSNLFAQNDGFFTYENYGTDRNSSWGSGAPGIPNIHGLSEDYKVVEAPLGNCIVLLAAMGLAYGMKNSSNLKK